MPCSHSPDANHTDCQAFICPESALSGQYAGWNQIRDAYGCTGFGQEPASADLIRLSHRSVTFLHKDQHRPLTNMRESLYSVSRHHRQKNAFRPQYELHDIVTSLSNQSSADSFYHPDVVRPPRVFLCDLQREKVFEKTQLSLV
jgi:hypothetical protein